MVKYALMSEETIQKIRKGDNLPRRQAWPRSLVQQ